MNLPILTSGLLTAIITVALAQDPDLRPLAWVTGCLLFVQVAGQVLILRGRARLGARLVMVADLLILPAGLPGAYGARRVLDDLARTELENHA